MIGKSMRLIKKTRFPAKKKDQSGGMLLLVVIIMAIALILITSALTITTAARNRYYNSALTDQATITASSVAKTIAAAVAKGDISMSEIDALAAANGRTGTTISVTSATSASKTAGSAESNKALAVAPGMYNNTNSITTVTVKYFTNSAGKELLQIEAKTGLDLNGAASTKTQTESVYLEKVTTGTPSGAFASLFMLGTPGSDNNFSNVVIGNVPTGKTAESNYIVLNGNIGISASKGGGQTLYSDVIFTGRLSTGAGNIYTGNVVFYGNNASMEDSAEKGSAIDTPGMILFLGGDTGKQNAFTTIDGTGKIVGAPRTGTNGSLTGDAGIYFSNTLVQYALESNWMSSNFGIYGDKGTRFEYTSVKLEKPNDNKVYLSSETGSKADLGSYYMNDTAKLFKDMVTPTPARVGPAADAPTFIEAMKTEANRIKTNMASAITRTIPDPDATGTTFYEDYGIKYKTEAEIKAASATQLDTELTGGATIDCKDPVYYIDVTTNNHVGDNYSATKEKAYPTYPFGQTLLRFDLTSTDITIYIFGAGGSGGTLYFGNGVFQFVNGGAHIGRIVLMPGVNIVLNKNNESGTRDNGIICTAHTITTAVPLCSTCDTKTLPKPCLYIYGIDNNEIYANINTTIEGYIGLYGANGKFSFDNGPKFYGRLEVTYINPVNTNFMTIPYCPSPTESGSDGSSTTSAYVIRGYQAA